jgi:hypothetical protein
VGHTHRSAPSAPYPARPPGALRPLPRFTAARARQVVEAESKAYTEFAQSYASFNPERLRRSAEGHLALFQLVGDCRGARLGPAVRARGGARGARTQPGGGRLDAQLAAPRALACSICCRALKLYAPPPNPPQDGNMGLVKQVLASLPARAIQRLTRTFLTLSLTDIAAHAGLPSAAAAEAAILR